MDHTDYQNYIDKGKEKPYWLSNEEKNYRESANLLDFAIKRATEETPFLHEHSYYGGEICCYHGIVYVTVVVPITHHRVYMLREGELFYVNAGCPKEVIKFADAKMSTWASECARFACYFERSQGQQ